MVRPNKIYGGMSGKTNNSIQSQIRITHEGLMSTKVGAEFNAYQEPGFKQTADIDPPTMDDYKQTTEDGQTIFEEKPEEQKKPIEGRGVHSIFNKFHAVPLEENSYGWRISQNMPLIDTPHTRQLQRALNSCTVRDLVEKSMAGMLGGAVYSYSDFMFCKYLGRVPNNYLITLRRYAIPVQDYIKPYGNPTAIKGNGTESTLTDNGGVPLATMVTWMGTPGNDMKDILKYNFSMPYKSVNSTFEDDGHVSNPSGKQSNGAIGGAFQKAFANNVITQRAANHVMPGMFNRRGGQTVSSRTPSYDKNKAYTGVDMIKSIYIRDGEKGLQFKQSFKLVFDYELRSYDGVNGKQAMLDLIGNILTCCYTTGDFWPGAYRRNSASSSMQPLSSLECMQHHGTFSEYVNAFQRDFQKLRGKISANFKDNPLEAIKSLLNDLGGALLGGDMDLAPIQYKNGVNALLSDTAVGLWHVTIGNPCAPIMSIGNLILTDTEIEHYGPLGIDDFPTGIRVTCTFDTGKPRDKRLIERMYNGGNDRIYVPLDKKVLEQLRNADKINQHIAETLGHERGKRGTAALETNKTIAGRREEVASAVALALQGADSVSITTPVLVDDIQTNDLVKRYFGDLGGNTQYAVQIAAGEVAEGNPKQQKQAVKQ